MEIINKKDLVEKLERNRRKDEEKIFIKILLTIFITWSMIAIVGIIYSEIKIRKEVYGWYLQAYSAADADQMIKWFKKLIEGMEKLGMTKGHYALLIKTPHNDISLDYQVFKNLMRRCYEIKKYSKGSMDYAESLKDIRQQMEKTGFSPVYWYFIHKFPYPILSLLISVPSIFLLSFLLFVIEDETFRNVAIPPDSRKLYHIYLKDNELKEIKKRFPDIIIR